MQCGMYGLGKQSSIDNILFFFLFSLFLFYFLLFSFFFIIVLLHAPL